MLLNVGVMRYTCEFESQEISGVISFARSFPTLAKNLFIVLAFSKSSVITLLFSIMVPIFLGFDSLLNSFTTDQNSFAEVVLENLFFQ